MGAFDMGALIWANVYSAVFISSCDWRHARYSESSGCVFFFYMCNAHTYTHAHTYLYTRMHLCVHMHHPLSTKVYLMRFVSYEVLTTQAKVVHMLWYSYSELHALLWLDILQSAIEQNDTVAELYKKGNVTVDIARAFAEHCSKAMEMSCQQQWKVEVCKWRDVEERDRFIRSVRGEVSEGCGQ